MSAYTASNDALVDEVARAAPAYLGESERSARTLEAMRGVDRAAFLPLEKRSYAYADLPIDIGSDQTCSQPSMVALMLDLLEIAQGTRILEVGAGSGYAAAIAAVLAGPTGDLVAAEIRPELAAIAQANLERWSRDRSDAAKINVVASDASDGLPGIPKFDRILVSAGSSGATFREGALVARLAEGGVLVWPQARGSLFKVRTRHGAIIDRVELRGVAFVPLLGRNS
jgi:protein-L-isoaspartate(D-aspartate) O-methyltransferase